ncbi:RNA polymerase sigma factor [Leucobacter sp. OH2974_COT-288]|nr:RNA polymerase sigma factor [Leucobacter sp. OH2974_COT-288]
MVSRAVDGDTQAFTTLLSRYTGMMISYALRITGSRADADDAVQEAFLVAWQKLDTLEDPRKAKSWLMRIVSHQAINVLRSHKHRGDQLGVDHAAAAHIDPAAQAEISGQMQALEGLLSQLPELQRQAWTLREIGGLSYQEIAEELQVPLSTVRGAIARSRQALVTGMEVWK